MVFYIYLLADVIIRIGIHTQQHIYGTELRIRIKINGFICAFGPPGSGSVIQRYGSGSFYKKNKKNLFTALCVLLDF
jgi:hypothetical protein